MSNISQRVSPDVAGSPDPGPGTVGWAVTVRRAVDSELIKLRTLRSQLWLLVVATTFTIALGPVQSLGEVLAESEGTVLSSAGTAALALAGASTASLVIGVLGVMTVAGEYAPRAIRSTFTLVPRRAHVVGAKALALGIVVVSTSAVAVAVAVTATIAVLGHAGADVGWTSPQVLRISAATVWYLVGCGVLGQAAGWLTGSKLGGATLLMTVMLVLTPVVGLVPGRVGEVLVALTPSSAGGAMLSSEDASALGAPLVGCVVWSAYLLLSGVVSAWAVARRDA